MLVELTIQDFAIIEKLFVRLDAGLTVLTGETGAGKSIIIDALQAALGSRVGGDVVRKDSRLSVVEAVFDRAGQREDDPVAAILSDNGIELEDQLILRREILATGRSTARLNGRAVPLSVLSAVGGLLVDIHGQSDHLSILRRDRQLDALDRYGNLGDLRLQAGEAIRQFGLLRRELDDVLSGRREAEQRLDLLRFQVQEIESANPEADEEENLGTERLVLTNAARLTQLSGTAYTALQGDSGAALDDIHRSLASLHELTGIDPKLDALTERLEASRYEVEDVARELRQYSDRTDFDPGRLEIIESRLDQLARLKRKYGPTVADVIAFGKNARSEMEDVENLEQRIETLSNGLEDAESRAGSLASELSKARQAAAASLTNAMGLALQGLGLQATKFEVGVAQSPSESGLLVPHAGRFSYGNNGIDSVTFLVSFNPGESMRPLERVASGGETSRFLLALKSVLAYADQIPTLIFDEIDVGVGARAGMNVAERLGELSQSHQVISITHLPHIAALADQHLTVSKVVADNRTSVTVNALETEDRVLEIAEMMTGSGTVTARQNAQELLEAAQRNR